MRETNGRLNLSPLNNRRQQSRIAPPISGCWTVSTNTNCNPYLR